MATVNLGRIKPVFRGAYDNSTSYVVDDIVTFGNETFIAIQAGSGNATSNASYWTKLAAKGTDGTDVSTTLTTQGDILYRDGSGLQRLAAGTSGQVLQTGGSGANPSWTTMSSDVVKLGSGTFSGNTATIDVNGYFTSDYRIYKLFISNMRPQNNSVNPRWRVLHSGNPVTSSIYRNHIDHWYGSNTSPTENVHTSSSYPENFFFVGGTNSTEDSVNNGTPTASEMLIFDPLNTTEGKQFLWQTHTHESGSSHSGQLNGWHGIGSLDDTTALSGLTFYFSSGNIKTMNWQLYGFKH